MEKEEINEKMKIVKNPNKTEWKDLLSRPALSVEGLYERVQTVLDTVRKGGDQALKDYELRQNAFCKRINAN